MSYFYILMVFVCGVVFSGNLTMLIEVNQDYEASWFNVGFSLFMAIVVGLLLPHE